MIIIATQCFGPDVGGIEAVMTGLADELSRSGRELTVFADRIRTPGAVEPLRSYPVRRFALWRPLRRPAKRAAIAQAARRIAVAGAFADSWKSVSALPQGVGPITVLAHGSEFPATANIWKAWRINRAFRRCAAIVASSHFTAQRLEPYLDGVAAKIEVVNPPIPQLPEAREAALADMDALIVGRRPVLATLARLEPRKGIDAVLRGLPSLRAKHPRLIYFVAGAGADLARLKQMTRHLLLETCVFFLGEVTDPQVKAALLTRSDLHVMPSRRVGNSVEGFGISYAEAGWYGVPSVAGANGGAGDAVIDGVTGAICRGDDDQDVLRAISRLLEAPDQARAMGVAAAELARAKMTWDVALPRYVATLAR